MLTKICQACGKEYQSPKNNSKYCSRECCHKGFAQKVEVHCEWCGKVLIRAPNRIKRAKHQFCCTEHKQKWMASISVDNHPLQKKERRICLNCDKVFYKRPSEKEKYCSLTCYAEHKKDRGNCVVCGKVVGRKGSKYCSRECMGIDRQSRIEKTCSICGKKFTRRPCEDRGDRSVCSKECADQLKKGDFRVKDSELEAHLLKLHAKLNRIPDLADLREAVKEDSNALHWSLYVRRGGLQYWQKKLFGKSTYRFVWETRCVDVFNEVLGYPDFKRQKTFPWLKNVKPGMKRPGVLRIDLYYPEYKLCIEFDGEGHFREISWGKGRDESLEDIRLRDELKTKLIKEHGLNMLRFRFDEPLEAEHVKERLTEFIELD